MRKYKLIILIVILLITTLTVVKSDKPQVTRSVITPEGNEIITNKDNTTQIIFGQYKPVPDYKYYNNKMQFNYTIYNTTYDECTITPMIITQTQIDQSAITHLPIEPKEISQLSIQEIVKINFHTTTLTSTTNSYKYEHVMNTQETKGFYYQLPTKAKYDNGTISCGRFSISLKEAIEKQGFKIDYLSKTNRLNFTGDYTLIDPDITFDSSQTVCGYYYYDTIVINNSAILSVCTWNSKLNNGTVTLNSTNFNMASGTMINATIKGYFGGNTTHLNGTGPGFGWGYPDGNEGVTYGSPTNVTSMGSGGGDFNGNLNLQNSGGGLITIIASTQANISGKLEADSGKITTQLKGGGSGGGIRITTYTLQGVFNVTAIGGQSPDLDYLGINNPGGASYGGLGGNGTGLSGSGAGGGGGGRIFIDYCASTATINYNVSGGKCNHPTCRSGSNGTFISQLREDCNPLITNATIITPTNGSYHLSPINITAQCTGQGNITADLYLNGTLASTYIDVTSESIFTFDVTLLSLTEYTAYVNCSNNASSSMLSTNVTFYNIGSTQCTSNCLKSVGSGCAAVLDNGCYMVQKV